MNWKKRQDHYFSEDFRQVEIRQDFWEDRFTQDTFDCVQDRKEVGEKSQKVICSHH